MPVTVPLHESQNTRPERLDYGKWKITLKVQPNYEFFSLIRSFGDGIEIAKPETMRIKMKEMVEKIAAMYKWLDYKAFYPSAYQRD